MWTAMKPTYWRNRAKRKKIEIAFKVEHKRSSDNLMSQLEFLIIDGNVVN